MVATQVAMAEMLGLQVYVVEEEDDDTLVIGEEDARLELDDPVCVIHSRDLVGWEEAWCPFCHAEKEEAELDAAFMRSHFCPECSQSYLNCTCSPF